MRHNRRSQFHPSISCVLLLSFVYSANGSLHTSKSLPQGRPSLNWDKYLLQPNFDKSNREKVIAAAGSTAFLHCKINNLADRAVTWIRKADSQVMTVNSYTYTTDQRISAHSSSDADEWVLKITSASIEDSGGYECQVSTETKISLTFELHVIVAYARISGTREVYMNSGGDLELSCRVGRITEPPDFVLWYHGRNIINYSDRSEVSVTMRNRGKASRLLIKGAQQEDSGNYTCAPSNAIATSVMVHIVKEERPAAMQHGDTGVSLKSNISSLIAGLVILIIAHLLNSSDQKQSQVRNPPLTCSRNTHEEIKDDNDLMSSRLHELKSFEFF